MARNTPKSKTPGPHKGPKSNRRPKTKKETCLALLRRANGTSLAELQKITGWQPHSVRGFLSGNVKNIPGMVLVTDIDDGRIRRYRIEPGKGS